MSEKRPIAAMTLPGVEPGIAQAETPDFRWVYPGELLVDEAYQRELSRGSIELIRKIVDVWACVARKALGRDAICTVWGRGYSLTATGIARVNEILGRPLTTNLPAQPTVAA